MKRKDFLRSTVTGAILPTVLNGFSLKSFAEDSPLAKLLSGSEENDHVLVIVQLQGGNDGLNMVIPLDNYRNYYNARSNVAIAENKVLSIKGNNRTGLHPAIAGLKALYEEEKLGIVQSVGYPEPSFSHFRATDIWMSGSASSEVLLSGWGGRFLDYEFPNFPLGYPNSSMPDPLGIQIGSVTSLVLQGPSASMGMSISNPTSFYNLVSGVEDTAPNTLAGKELQYIREVSKQTSAYASVVKNAALKVNQQASYPVANPLGEQLKIVARLIKGGLKTKIYMVSYGSFDTHSLQADNTNTTIGRHATLLKNVGDAIKAFQDDLKYLNIEDRVMGITFSEFGRRIKSNNSGGTDHGSAAPLMVFGTNAVQMVHGKNPDIADSVSVNDNIPMQYDFRSVYASMLQDWLCVKPEALQQIMFKNFQNIPLVKTSACNPSLPNNSGKNLISNFPNPFNQNTTISFTTAGGHTLIQIMNTLGQLVATPLDNVIPAAGTYTVQWASGSMPTGVYYARLQNGNTQQVRSMLKVR